MHLIRTPLAYVRCHILTLFSPRFIYHLCLEIRNMPVEVAESDPHSGYSRATYSNNDASKGGDEIPTDPQDLTLFVQSVLEQMVRVTIVLRIVRSLDIVTPSFLPPILLQSENFQKMSSNIITRVDEMGKRLGDLEQSIENLQNNSNVDVPHLPLDSPDDTTTT